MSAPAAQLSTGSRLVSMRSAPPGEGDVFGDRAFPVLQISLLASTADLPGPVQCWRSGTPQHSGPDAARITTGRSVYCAGQSEAVGLCRALGSHADGGGGGARWRRPGSCHADSADSADGAGGSAVSGWVCCPQSESLRLQLPQPPTPDSRPTGSSVT